MKTKKQVTFSRRSFLKTSTLASGGMLIGFNLFNSCKEGVKPPVDLSKLNYNDFNAFIKISDEGKVTIFSPNPEIGQGVKTSMPMLIAEELDVAWKDVYVVQAPLDNKNYTRQVAGGSGSIRTSWEPLRQTGATAKQMLLNAAATRWGVEVSECSVKEGIITNSKGETLGYGDVVKEAAVLEIPEEVTLKEPKDFTIIGKGKGNVDIDKIITGKPLFGLDYKEKDMLYACVLRPPAFGQMLESFDDSEARKVSGVVDVIVIGEKARLLKPNWSLQMSKSDKVVVLAKNTWAAIKGKKALKAIWKADSKLESTTDHHTILSDLLNGNKFENRIKIGNIKPAFAQADKIIERTYEAPFLPHNPMEPMNFFANVTPERVHLVGPIQTPAGAEGLVSEMLGRDAEDIHLEMTRMGGGFGRRLYADFVCEAAEISDKAQKPIKMISTREDDMTTGVYRPSVKYKISASIKKGEITGYHLKDAAINNNIYGPITTFFPAGSIDNFQIDSVNYESNVTTGAWRAPITNFLATAEQSFFDELAETLDIDPVQLRMDLIDKAKKAILNSDIKISYDPDRLKEVLKVAAERSNWGNVTKDVYQGVSVYFSHATHVAEVVDIIMENDIPVVKKVTCVVDCGIVVNPLGALNQAKGGIIDGIGHAMYGDLVLKDGIPQANNFDKFRLIRMRETPVEIDVHFIKNDIAPTGLGEPTLPPVGGAIANAIYAATGKRLTKQPFISALQAEKTMA